MAMLEKGDIITEVDGKKIKSTTPAKTAAARVKCQSTCTLIYNGPSRGPHPSPFLQARTDWATQFCMEICVNSSTLLNTTHLNFTTLPLC